MSQAAAWRGAPRLRGAGPGRFAQRKLPVVIDVPVGRLTCPHPRRQLHGGGCRDFEVLDQVAPPNASAACGEVADARGADLLVLSADAVHAKAVDANLLAVSRVSSAHLASTGNRHS